MEYRILDYGIEKREINVMIFIHSGIHYCKRCKHDVNRELNVPDVKDSTDNTVQSTKHHEFVVRYNVTIGIQTQLFLSKKVIMLRFPRVY